MSVAASVSALGQEQPALRAEFMSRLRALERVWVERLPGQERSKAVAFVSTAEQRLFASDLPDACRALDRARETLLDAKPDWMQCAAISWTRRLFDVRDTRANPTIFTLYPVERSHWAEGCVFMSEIRTVDGSGGSELWSGTVQINARASYACSALLEPVSLGDILCSMSVGETFHWHRRVMLVSIVEKRDERLAALKVGIEAAREKGPRLEVDSAEMLRELLNSLASGSTEAHDYPGARLLEEAEHVVTAAAKGERWYRPQRDGEFWLALPIGATSVRTRVFVPSGLSTEKPATLVIALHGRSFDEDTWFDGYGGGQSVELARKRGWVLAAPHCDGNEDAAKLAAITKSLGDVYPIDMSRVLLVGHSRGGGSALNAVAQAPDRFHAVATIGSALEPARASSLNKRPLFLAAGDHDFAREGVETLHKALVASGATNATFKLYPNTEHWLCVTDALPDVFTWFDAQMRDEAGVPRAK